jgi:hypothetical protein
MGQFRWYFEQFLLLYKMVATNNFKSDSSKICTNEYTKKVITVFVFFFTAVAILPLSVLFLVRSLCQSYKYNYLKLLPEWCAIGVCIALALSYCVYAYIEEKTMYRLEKGDRVAVISSPNQCLPRKCNSTKTD